MSWEGRSKEGAREGAQPLALGGQKELGFRVWVFAVGQWLVYKKGWGFDYAHTYKFKASVSRSIFSPL